MNLNGNSTNSYKSPSASNAVSFVSVSRRGIWWYALFRSKVKNTLHWDSLFTMSLIHGNRYASNPVNRFIVWELMRILFLWRWSSSRAIMTCARHGESLLFFKPFASNDEIWSWIKDRSPLLKNLDWVGIHFTSFGTLLKKLAGHQRATLAPVILWERGFFALRVDTILGILLVTTNLSLFPP